MENYEEFRKTTGKNSLEDRMDQRTNRSLENNANKK